MANLLKVPLPGYLTATPRRLWWVGDLFGNNNYQQGGDTLRATDLGMTGLEWVDIIAGGMSVSQNYFVQVFMPANSANVKGAGFGGQQCDAEVVLFRQQQPGGQQREPVVGGGAAAGDRGVAWRPRSSGKASSAPTWGTS